MLSTNSSGSVCGLFESSIETFALELLIEYDWLVNDCLWFHGNM
jgi:hypothetical protein